MGPVEGVFAVQVHIHLSTCQNEPIIVRVEGLLLHKQQLTNQAGVVQLVRFALFPLGLDLAELFQDGGEGASEALLVTA